jgi:hypothetical protein
MFPQPMRNVCGGVADKTVWLGANVLYYGRNALWIGARTRTACIHDTLRAGSTTFMFMLLPYIVVKEGVDMERAQQMQQRQLLLGPSAAVTAAAK